MNAIPARSHAVGHKRYRVLRPDGVRRAVRSLSRLLTGSKRIGRFVPAEATSSSSSSSSSIFYKRSIGAINRVDLRLVAHLTIHLKVHCGFCRDPIECQRQEASGGYLSYLHASCIMLRRRLVAQSHDAAVVTARTTLQSVSASGSRFCFRHELNEDTGLWLETKWQQQGDLTQFLPFALWDLVKTFVPDAPISKGRLYELVHVQGKLSTSFYHVLSIGANNSVVSRTNKRILPLGATFKLF